LLVATGCLGGLTSGDDEQDQLACGEEYVDRRSTLGAVLVRISRRYQYGRLGIQVVHASMGTGIIDVSSAPAPGMTDSIFTLASQLRYGVILPRSPRLDVSAAGIGAARNDWRVRAVGNGSELYTEDWRVIAERSDPPRAALFPTDPLPADPVGAP
jgi:hypothetical protein